MLCNFCIIVTSIVTSVTDFNYVTLVTFNFNCISPVTFHLNCMSPVTFHLYIPVQYLTSIVTSITPDLNCVSESGLVCLFVVQPDLSF